MTAMNQIQDFLGQKRLAIVGVSRAPQDFSRVVFREFCQRGYDAVPVNPEAQEIDGQQCFADIKDVQPPVQSVLLMTSPSITDTVVRECAAAGVQRVWMHRGGGRGAVSADAVEFCKSQGMAVIPGECPLMFLPGGSWFHRMHGWVKKIYGAYPR
jgi:uncharacterized protein